MKNGTKRRAWTSVQVRELKSMARKARKLKALKEPPVKKRSVLDYHSTRALDGLTPQEFSLCSSRKAPPFTCAGLSLF